MSCLRRLARYGLLAALAEPALAHDFWLDPTTFTPANGQRVAVTLRVGQHFQGDALARDPSQLLQFVAIGAGGERPVAGADGYSPAGVALVGGDELVILAYQSRGAVAELDAQAMQRYVTEEGLAPQLDARWRELPVVRDAYSRCAKALLRPAGASSRGFDRVVGHPLELVLLGDPQSARAGHRLRARLLEDGVAIEGIRVKAISRLDPAAVLHATTDSQGVASFELARGGAWLLVAVRIEPAPLGSDADYRSRWASLTFEVAP